MEKLDRLYSEWCSLQPLKPEYQKKLDEKFKLEFNYNSNHIEGNTLTYGQTKLLFMFGETSGSASLKDYEEMQAHNVGLEMMKVVARDKERPLTESFLRELNKTILVKNYWKTGISLSGQPTRMEINVGTYKTRPNSVLTVTGEEFNYATPEETPAFMTALVDWYNQEEARGELSPIELASLLHYRYIRIHPFEDGNGRIARLLVNYVLHRHGYPMLVVHTTDKNNYLRILHQCDINAGLTPSDGANATIGQIQPFVEYMEEQLQRALEISIRAAKGEDIEEEDDFAKKLAILQRKLSAEKLKETQSLSFSEEQVWDILEKFYFPLTKHLIKVFDAAKVFFSHINYWNQLSKTSYAEEGVRLNDVLRSTHDSQVLDFVRNAKSMWFHYELSRPKEEKMGDLSFTFELSIAFQENNYVVSFGDEKTFEYGEYPSEDECKAIVSHYKTALMKGLEDALK